MEVLSDKMVINLEGFRFPELLPAFLRSYLSVFIFSNRLHKGSMPVKRSGGFLKLYFRRVFFISFKLD